MSLKRRLDELLFGLGLSESRTKAAELIRSGKVTVDGMIVLKPGYKVDSDREIVASNSFMPVGRGYYKLKKAIDEFRIKPEGKRVLDVGASTGGFAQLLLDKGAASVICVDVGKDQIGNKLREDSRILSVESTDIRDFSIEQFGGEVDLLTADLSFISTAGLAELFRMFLKDNGEAVVLIKPQFEVGPGVVKKGLVRSRTAHREVIEVFVKAFVSSGMFPVGITFSPIKGKRGNIEYLLYSVAGETFVELDYDYLIEKAFAFFDRDSNQLV